ncbi:hypothetical protein D2V07_14440 [Aurantiacibacter zhengii]|uniref:Lipoprotein n=2 Tax=Aurantiacibacter zhengii TaxID=2307003 RepID=A0A418NPW4_9SPHN|nr:hypothetical protein D2V07_14440 [Aurantiacibacter zhengii]
MKELNEMRIPKETSAIASFALASLIPALAACDQAPESTPTSEVSPMGEAAAMPGTAPEENLGGRAASPSEGETGVARQDALSTRNAATPASQGAAPPVPRATATSAAPATAAQPESEEATLPADPHAGHDMSSMADHDMEGM